MSAAIVDDDENPFTSAQPPVEQLLLASIGDPSAKVLSHPAGPSKEEKLVSAPKRRRNTVTGSEGTVTAPLTPSTMKVEEPVQGVSGMAKRATRRRRQ